MKKRIIIVGAAVIVIVLVIIGFFVMRHNYIVNFTIPEGYLKKIELHESYVDGSDVDYYVYSDKVIVDERSYYPAGLLPYTHERTVIQYSGFSLNEEDVKKYNEWNCYKLTEGKKNKTILHDRR